MRPFFRISVIASAVVLMTGGGVATAAPGDTVNGQIVGFTATATTLTAVNRISNFPLGPIIPLPATIYRVVGGSPQVVADGVGFVQYQCDGTAINTYTAVGRELTVPCG